MMINLLNPLNENELYTHTALYYLCVPHCCGLLNSPTAEGLLKFNFPNRWGLVTFKFN